jgi:ABC-2 type transport system permease protein
MTDAWTVARKELGELFGERLSRRGAMVQAVILTLGLGVLVPHEAAVLWLVGSPEAIILFLLLPAIVAGGIGADAFAGERERRTLDTLLATPLSDAAVVAGKAIAAISVALAVAAVSLVIGAITVNVTAHPAALFVPSPALWAGGLLGALACSCVSTAVAIALSLRTPVARSVQQMVSLMFVLPALVGGMLARYLGFELTWPHVFEVEAVAILAGLAGLAGAAARFHRDRLFENR